MPAPAETDSAPDDPFTLETKFEMSMLITLLVVLAVPVVVLWDSRNGATA